VQNSSIKLLVYKILKSIDLVIDHKKALLIFYLFE